MQPPSKLGKAPSHRSALPREAGRAGAMLAPQGAGAVLRVQPGGTHGPAAHGRGPSRQRENPGFHLSAGEAARDKQQTPQKILLSENEI